jgi:hypothetical protein
VISVAKLSSLMHVAITMTRGDSRKRQHPSLHRGGQISISASSAKSNRTKDDAAKNHRSVKMKVILARSSWRDSARQGHCGV